MPLTAFIIASLSSLCLAASLASERRGTPGAATAQIVVTVDWEGRDLRDENLEAMRQFRLRHPDVKLVHFMNAAYFTKRGMTDGAREAARAKIATTIRDGDEVGLHLHGWESLFQAAGVKYLDRPTYLGMSHSQGLDDRGHDVPISEYSEDDLRAAIRASRAILGHWGFGEIKSFRAGGWMGAPHVLAALAAEKILIDSSALPADLRATLPLNFTLMSLVRKIWPQARVDSQPYLISTPHGAILEAPNNGGMADYSIPGNMLEMFRANWASAKSSGLATTFNLGFHQETAARNAQGVEVALGMIVGLVGHARLRYATLVEIARESQAASSLLPAPARGTLRCDGAIFGSP
jgi:hypothetical protein